MTTNLWAAITQAEQAGTLRSTLQPDRTDATRIHIAPDLHYPYQNKDVVSHIIDLCAGCDIIIQIGDGVDNYLLSDFDKDPAREANVQTDVDEYREGFWRPIREQAPKARLIQILGNHEERFKRYIWKRAPHLASLRSMAWSAVLEAAKYDVEVHPRSGLLIANTRIKHGDTVRSGPGATSRAEMEMHRTNGISAHTHRWEHIIRKDKEGYTTWWRAIGHACDVTKAEYVQNPDWHLSAGITLTLYPDGVLEAQEHRL